MQKNKNEMQLFLPENTAVVLKNGTVHLRFEFNAHGGIDVCSNVPVSIHSPLNADSQYVRVPEIGEEVVNGWKYGGISVSIRLPLFVAPKDEPIRKKWKWATEDAAALKNFLGHDGSQQKTAEQLLEACEKNTHDHGVRLPTLNELDRNLYLMRDAIGGFKTEREQLEEQTYADTRYWSSQSNHSRDARCQCFNSGHKSGKSQTNNSFLVRLVRS